MTLSPIISIFLVLVVIAFVVLVLASRKPNPGISSDNDVLDILNKGDKLKAIKAYRQLHGVGLKKAKQALDNLSNEQK